MGNTLLQNQIDALLSALKIGKMDADEISGNGDLKAIRKYDFYSPKKFTKDRIKLLDSIYQSYSRMVASYISGILRDGCEVNVSQIEEKRYYEFSDAMSDSDILSLINLSSDTEKMINGTIMIQISNEVTFSMMDRMLGGSGEGYKYYKDYTDIDLAIYEHTIKNIVPMMREAWANYVNIDAEYHRIETNPRLVQTIGVDETVVIIVLNITIKNLSGKINICIPASILEGIFKAFDNNSTRANKRKEMPDPQSHEEIMRKISDSFLDVKACLGQTEIHLSDLYNMEIGDVILLNKDKDSTVDLYVGDTPWFSGKLGTKKQNMVVKIYEKYNHLDI